MPWIKYSELFLLWLSVPDQPKVIIKLRQFLTWLGTPSELKSKEMYQIPIFLGDYLRTKCLKYWYIPSRYKFKEPYWTRTFPPKLISQNFPGNLIFADSYNTVSTSIEHYFQPNLITQLYRKVLEILLWVIFKYIFSDQRQFFPKYLTLSRNIPHGLLTPWWVSSTEADLDPPLFNFKKTFGQT